LFLELLLGLPPDGKTGSPVRELVVDALNELVDAALDFFFSLLD